MELQHAEDDSVEHAEDDSEDDADEGPTVQEVYDSMTDVQKDVVHYMVGAALEAQDEDEGAAAQSATSNSDEAVSHSDDESESELVHTDDKNEEEGRRMTRNVFEEQSGGKKEEHVLSHDALKGIVEDAHRSGSLKEAFESYAIKHGIENIDVLFPDARNVTDYS